MPQRQWLWPQKKASMTTPFFVHWKASREPGRRFDFLGEYPLEAGER
jgi:hypothetical protein